MKNRIICVFTCLMMLVGCAVLCSCSEADKVNRNISKQANYFEAERRITVYNARTDNVILEMEGAMSISNNDNNELVCTVKTGPNEYGGQSVFRYNNRRIDDFHTARLIAFDLFDEQYESRGEVQPYWDGMRWLYY